MQILDNPHNQRQKSQPLRIIAIGDSLIYGYGDTEGGGWVERLRRYFMNSDQDHVLYNLGIRGDGISQVNSRLCQEFSHRGELRNKYPDLIILSVGVNDTPRLGHIQGRNLTNYQKFTEDINSLLDQAQKLCSVMFVGMIPVDEEKMPFLDCLYYNLRDQYHYKEVTKQACETRNIPYLDLFDMWMSRGEYWRKTQMSKDGLHPNIKGYESLFHEIVHWQPLQLIIRS
ncbi:MAG: G-D-S-L family lipolytic protein [Cyanobacteria bacterium]|nr:G-D-S-L family lipolytic protein [Cyanobacteria bacterium CG_2015-16_32_12]NCO78931.1 G-D-S-L family lipolytic protein [Cyanobacteria bacterium CG_2015-22_32_23]NCQ04952.1 G-D-S-L family lipolytic protein [Cyanobacteria bacterium CG_2015-09_32_10]NCS83804.1 G-D-S-L family lipolytic protein [Cyanobacteria bacterium CG_2015-02_32_10]